MKAIKVTFEHAGCRWTFNVFPGEEPGFGWERDPGEDGLDPVAQLVAVEIEDVECVRDLLDEVEVWSVSGCGIEYRLGASPADDTARVVDMDAAVAGPLRDVFEEARGYALLALPRIPG